MRRHRLKKTQGKRKRLVIVNSDKCLPLDAVWQGWSDRGDYFLSKRTGKTYLVLRKKSKVVYDDEDDTALILAGHSAFLAGASMH